jgi:hypothetical protein
VTPRRIGLGVIVAITAIAAAARADEEAAIAGALPAFGGAPLTFHAGSLEADPAQRRLELRDDVEVRFDRYRLTSDHLRLAIAPGAVSFEGDGRVAFCPCPDPPVALGFQGARITTDGDLVVRAPRLVLFGVPVFALPYFWLRAPSQPGLLFPSISIRGADGLVLGSGVHLPFREADEAPRAFDVTAAGYVNGGVEIGARLTTPATSARLIVDHRLGDRVVLAARGALASGDASLAWEADAIRGERARAGTSDLDAAARPFDHAGVEGSLRVARGSTIAGFTAGVLARGARGQGSLVAGPTARVAASGSIGKGGAWSASAGGVVLGNALPAAALPLGRAAISAAIDARPGPFALRVAAAARAEVALDAPAAPSRDASASARIELDLPLQRAFPRGDGEAPWQHRIAPSIAVAAAASAQQGAFFAPLALAAPPGLGLAAAGLTTSFGRVDGPALRLDARGGAALGAAGLVPLVGGRLAASAPLVAGSLEIAAVPAPRAPGSALIGRARLGAAEGLRLALGLAGQTGRGAREARAVVDLRADAPGGDRAYLAAAGWTGSAEAMIPWLGVLQSGARVDLDLAAGQLLAWRGVTEYRNSCGCLALGASAAHRTGRGGVDVIFTVDLLPVR